MSKVKHVYQYRTEPGSWGRRLFINVILRSPSPVRTTKNLRDPSPSLRKDQNDTNTLINDLGGRSAPKTEDLDDISPGDDPKNRIIRKLWLPASVSALFFGLLHLILEACPVRDNGEQRRGGTTRPVHP